jgi:hypothetical protein
MLAEVALAAIGELSPSGRAYSQAEHGPASPSSAPFVIGVQGKSYADILEPGSPGFSRSV